MTRISFYLLKGDDIDNRQVYACRLAEKAYTLGHHVYIHTNSAVECKQIDHALWSFRADSFVPHLIVNDRNTDCPVLIGYDSKPP
ncbi:MAG: DNA polymerase III subunit chi, partial [Gammaproteobacteria bacterium]|nr:DNA polymerase III subunit chi [Gammaproteobacteria bacterium]